MKQNISSPPPLFFQIISNLGGQDLNPRDVANMSRVTEIWILGNFCWPKITRDKEAANYPRILTFEKHFLKVFFLCGILSHCLGRPLSSFPVGQGRHVPVKTGSPLSLISPPCLSLPAKSLPGDPSHLIMSCCSIS